MRTHPEINPSDPAQKEFRWLRLSVYAVLIFGLLLEPLTFGRFQIPPERMIILMIFLIVLMNWGRDDRHHRSSIYVALGGLGVVFLASTVTYLVTSVGARQIITATLLPPVLFLLGFRLTRSQLHLQHTIWAATVGAVISTLTLWVWSNMGAAYPLYHENKGFLAYVISIGTTEMSIWANWTASFGVMLSILSLFTTILDASLIRRGMAAVTYLLGGYIAFQSGAKAGPVGVALFTLLGILFFAREVFSRRSGMLFVGAGAAIVFGLYRGIQSGAAAELLNIDTHLQRFMDFGNNYGSLQYRVDAIVYSWNQGRMGLTGIGFGRAWTLDSIDESVYLLWLGNGAGFLAVAGHLIFVLGLGFSFVRAMFSSERVRATGARCGLIMLLLIESMSFSSDQFLGEAVTGHWLFFILGACAGVILQERLPRAVSLVRGPSPSDRKKIVDARD